MLRVALRPRYLGLLALMVVATVACGLLATWQWERAQRALTEDTSVAQELGPVQGVLGLADPVTNELVGGIVTADGRFDPQRQILVGGREIDGTAAVIVVTALEVTTDEGEPAILPVARGWVPAAQVTGDDGELDPALAPAPPSGQVEVGGRLEASEAATEGVREGIATEIATPLLVNAWGGPMYAGYVAQTTPAEGLRPMPVAESAFQRGLDWQNIGYAAQWIVFGAFFLYLWVRTVRTAHLDELAAQREQLERSLAPSAGEAPDQRPDPGAPAGTAPTQQTQEDADAGTPTPR